MVNERLVVPIALTSGPGGGKTTTLAFLQERISQFGRDVYRNNEMATLLIEQGMRIKAAIAAKDWNKVLFYQKEIMGATLENHQRMHRCAEREGRPAVILCDRGLPDCRAYLPEGDDGYRMYRELLDEFNLKTEGAWNLYVAVIKLMTAAKGETRPYYTTENNMARDETPELACYLDDRIEKAYNGHPHLIPIQNFEDFEQKKLEVLRAVCRVLGIPMPIEIEKKFRIDYPCFQHFGVDVRTINIEQAYIIFPDKPDEEFRIRSREYDGGQSYFITHKRPVGPKVRVEVEDSIGWRTYYELMARRDPRRGVIKKRRHCFLWENQYFELDSFTNLNRALTLLEVELTDEQKEVVLPPAIRMIEDVTDNPDFKNYNLALQVRN